MQIIELKDRVVYRASSGKKVKFVGSESKHTEIVVKHKTDKIVEVNEGE